MDGKNMLSQLCMKAQHSDEDNIPPSSSSMDLADNSSPYLSLSSISKPRETLEKLGAKEPLSAQDKTTLLQPMDAKKENRLH